MAENKNAKGTKKGNKTNKSTAKKSTKTTTVKNDNIKAVAKEEKTIKEEVVTKTEGNDSKRNIIIALIAGIVIGLLIMLIFMPDRIAKLQNGEEVIVKIGDETITADMLYTNMKNYYSVNVLLDDIDKIVLTKLYPENNDMKTEVNDTADYYISMYETYYGYTEDQFLQANGFKSRDEFINALLLDYRRNKCYDDYVASLITDSEITKYYENNVSGDIETKYISVAGTTDEAKALAERVITRLKSGSTYESVVEHYGDRIKVEDLEYVSFDADLDSIYWEALKALKDNSYTTEPVKGTDDYKVIFRGETKEKSSLEEVKDKIVTILANEKKNDDSTLAYKALIEMRKNNDVSIKDTDLAKKYEDYIKTYTSNDSE